MLSVRVALALWRSLVVHVTWFADVFVGCCGDACCVHTPAGLLATQPRPNTVERGVMLLQRSCAHNERVASVCVCVLLLLLSLLLELY